MKKLRLSLVAVALLVGAAAYATGSKANDLEPCDTTSGSIDAECPFGTNVCCESTAQVTQTQNGHVVTILANQQVMRK